MLCRAIILASIFATATFGAVPECAALIPAEPTLAANLSPSITKASTKADAQENLLRSVAAHLASLPPSRRRSLLETALSYLGAPYVWGGDDLEADGGFDCAGLAFHLYHASGLEFPRARFSSLNMTEAPRGRVIPKVWWTAYAPDFAAVMVNCDGVPTEDGDVLVYHARKDGKIVDRTGHVVLVADAETGHAVSAARGGVRLHALGDFSHYAARERTACWRAPSASLPPFVRPSLTWTFPGQAAAGTRTAPFVMAPPLDLDATVAGEGIAAAHVEVLGRVLAFLAAVEPSVDERPPAGGRRSFHIHHDFRRNDLPTDPGEVIATALRRIVLRLVDDGGHVLGERAVYVRFNPYWH